MKKLLCLFLAVVLVLSLIPGVSAEKEAEPPVEVKVITNSNLRDIVTIPGIYQDNVFYVTAETIASLTGGDVMTNTKHTLVFSLHSDLRIITVTDDGTLSETHSKDTFTTSIPTLLYKDTLYVSAVHLLRYMGATVGFGENENSPVHMMVSMPYTVLDLFAEFNRCNGYQFSWSEADSGKIDPDDILYLAALDTVLLCYDPNLLAYTNPIHANQIEKQIYTDVLVEIARNDGSEELSESDASLALFGHAAGTTQLTSTFIGEVMDWIDEPTFSKSLQSSMSVAMDGAGIFMDATGDYLNSLETARQFANMADAQKNLLSNTFNRVSKSSSLYKQNTLLFEAANEATDLIGDQYAANEKAQWDYIHNLLVNTATAIMSNPFPIMAAWDAIAGILQLDPLTGKLLSAERNITFAAECEAITDIGVQLLRNDIDSFNRKNAYLTDPTAGNQEYLKADMILILKSVLTTRQLLLDTNWLTEKSENNMRSTVTASAKLLNRAQNATPTAIGVMPACNEDITWIRFLTAQADFGSVVNAGGKTYYWRYTANSFSESGARGFSHTQVHNDLYCMDENGKQEKVMSLNSHGDFAIVNNQLFYRDHDGCIYSVFLDGTGKKNWGSGTLEAVSDNGAYVVFTDTYSKIRLINVPEGHIDSLSLSGSFLALRSDVLYYTVEADYQDVISLHSITLSEREKTHIYTSTPGLYDYGTSWADIAQLAFADEYIYFSYGCGGGSGMFYQGGRVVRVRYDGTEAQVLAGQDELVGPNFSINADGTVSVDNDPFSEALFVFRQDYAVQSGVLSLYNEEDAEVYAVLYPSEYSSLLEGSKLEDYDSDPVVLLGEHSLKGDLLYCCLHLAAENPDPPIWSLSHIREKTVYLVKNLRTGEIDVLYTIE